MAARSILQRVGQPGANSVASVPMEAESAPPQRPPLPPDMVGDDSLSDEDEDGDGRAGDDEDELRPEPHCPGSASSAAGASEQDEHLSRLLDDSDFIDGDADDSADGDPSEDDDEADGEPDGSKVACAILLRECKSFANVPTHS